jgi:hypothetical protein
MERGNSLSTENGSHENIDREVVGEYQKGNIANGDWRVDVKRREKEKVRRVMPIEREVCGIRGRGVIIKMERVESMSGREGSP